MRGNRRLEMQFQSLSQILEGLFFGSALAGDIDIQALGDEPFPLAPDSSRKRTLHETTLAQSTPTRFKLHSLVVRRNGAVCGRKRVYQY
jgi:hypothetical protein